MLTWAEASLLCVQWLVVLWGHRTSTVTLIWFLIGPLSRPMAYLSNCQDHSTGCNTSCSWVTPYSFWLVGSVPLFSVLKCLPNASMLLNSMRTVLKEFWSSSCLCKLMDLALRSKTMSLVFHLSQGSLLQNSYYSFIAFLLIMDRLATQ